MELQSSNGLKFEFLENGAVKSINADPVRISLKAGSLFSYPGCNIYLRKRTDPIDFTALTGPHSPAGFSLNEAAYVSSGSWNGIEYICTIRLSDQNLGWQWAIDLKNTSAKLVDMDVVYLQDIGLKPVNAGLINEYYVSQYLERSILEDKKYGAVICCRQNMKESTGHPWLMLACGNGAVAGSTDGMQFFGRTFRETGIPEGLLMETLPGEYAGESPVVALQEKPFCLEAGATHQSIFYGAYMPDHPLATSEEDLSRLPGLLLEFINETPSHFRETPSHFNTSPFLPVDDLDDDEITNFFGTVRHHAERENGRILSFFNNNNHVVLRAKELLADRPHAHIIQAAAGFVPDENIMSTTSFMFGVFNSHITQGNTNFNVLLSVCTSQFNQDPGTGQRIFVEIDGRRYLLGVPSAFEMGLNHCRWIYKHGGNCFQVRTWTSKIAPQVNMDFKVIDWEMRRKGEEGTGRRGEEEKGRRGDKEKGRKTVRLIITLDFDALNGWEIVPGMAGNEFRANPKETSMIKGKFPHAGYRIVIDDAADLKAGGDELLFGNKQNHGSSLFVIETGEIRDFHMSFTGEVCQPAEIIHLENTDEQFLIDCRAAWTEWQDLSLSLSLESKQEDIAAIREILPWYGMNALTHFLTPYGLEQFSGAAWGTRDVSQGPVDLLLTMGKYDEARQVLQTIFSNQNPDGGWPQWWMFDSYANIRSDSSHDDIYYWTIIALSNYIKTTGETGFLNELLPYYHEKGPEFAEKSPLREHIDRLISMITASFIPGTALVPFGGGDWNDSLQPVSKELAQRMISSWTVEMSFQAFSQYLGVFETTGDTLKAATLKEICGNIKADFNRHLVKDDVVAGYGLVEKDGGISVMLHPADDRTGVHYSILPMERGILSGIFTKEQALHHQELIEKHLKGPDGARLMDRPLKYKGGIQGIFQRAESSTFFGREIGLMYVHEHIRYAESLAMTGKAKAFVKALRQAIPVGYRDVVTCGDIRQANCYYSSSDVHFKNRYEADERYDEVIDGKFTLRGGWRVYSSGPGIYIGLIMTKLLGLRIDSGNVIIDPVMPFAFDGLTASLEFMEVPVVIRYSVKEGNFSPKSITINGGEIHFKTEENKYRKGGAVIALAEFLDRLDQQENIINVAL